MSKHEDIIKYILSLDVGTKISVRSIASDLGVSDGTAYRAIKDSDNLGIVTTIPRVGTIRIEKVEKKNIESLTYGEVINIIDGTLLGGKDGVYKVLHYFVIGAMTIDAMEKYIKKDCLLIVGNREEAQRLALLNNSGVLITGGFQCSDEIRELANEKCLPVISTTYDTFTVASMINKAISENLIKKDIVLIEDIMENNPEYLSINDTALKWRENLERTQHERYPVVDNKKRVVGIVTLKDIPNKTSDDELIGKLMYKNPITLTPKATVAYAAHIMGWEGIELFPVVNGKTLVGVVTRKDVIRALQYMARQPQLGETFEDLVLKEFEFNTEGDCIHFYGKIVPEMLNPIGTASWSSLNMILSTMGVMTLRQNNNINVLVDSISTYFMKPLQIDSVIHIYSNIVDIGRNFCKIEIDMYNDKKQIAGKCILSARIIRS
ncbi:CBS domain-containing protein [Clostridium tyrobutyricum]|uniref:DRTGG domain-containing protein n=1 Tax=Clostridium tyrobutyricum TaxID=1519 RepID=UPI001C38B85D|nr:DRTGG domain-containing protein [Clostridium tyrobutyricum]MBV4417975.1 CBS domain-containing protein [Clostridium tyrobutyricum]